METYAVPGQDFDGLSNARSDELEFHHVSRWFENRDVLSVTAAATRQPEPIASSWKPGNRLDRPTVHRAEPELGGNPDEHGD